MERDSMTLSGLAGPSEGSAGRSNETSKEGAGARASAPGPEVADAEAGDFETGEVRPLGSNELLEVNVRVVSATHRDLERAIEEGHFRTDLFYRLSGASLYLPPLRRRRVDIPFLAQHFAEEFGEDSTRRIVLGSDFLDALSQRDFPGNVRELRNAVERAIALAQPGQTLTADDLPPDESGRPTFFAMGTLRDRIAQVEVQAIQEALERFDGNKTRAAEALGISRLGLRQKMQRLRLVYESERLPETRQTLLENLRYRIDRHLRNRADTGLTDADEPRAFP
jgi:hypothetical protein